MTEGVYLADEAATVAFGEQLGAAVAAAPGFVSIHLAGTLGAGKTTLTRGVLRHFGHTSAVKSPTYTLVEVYDLPERPVYHFDLYRLGDPEELEYMGIRDYFDGAGVALIEWPTRGEGILPPPDLAARLEVQGAGRIVKLEAGTDAGQRIITALQESEK